MTIDNFAFACAIDDSTPYFTYEDQAMIIVQSKDHAIHKISGFNYIEPFIESLISHESVHVVIKKLEGGKISDSLDDLEIIVQREGTRFQVTMNNMLFAKDMSGMVTP
ncbi:MAG TPA: hypothetical protein VIP70_01090 [Nitrososphaeraceae archaeon]|jgi:hypothetical protein